MSRWAEIQHINRQAVADAPLLDAIRQRMDEQMHERSGAHGTLLSERIEAPSEGQVEAMQDLGYEHAGELIQIVREYEIKGS